MILAAGLTPALQQILVFERLRIGEVNRAREAYTCASGKVLNVGIALHHLGGPNLTLALLGGPSGESIDREFVSLGIHHRWVWTQRPTRICTTLIDRSDGTTTELVENAPPVEEEAIEQFLHAYDEAVAGVRTVVLIGSLPSGMSKTFYRDLIQRTAARVVLDVSGQEFLASLPLKPFCVKPNRDELGRSLGHDLQSQADLRNAMEEVNRMGAEWVLVSQGTNALWASHAGRIHIFHPAKVTTLNPIASGDCLAAGVAWAMENGMNMLDAIRFGMAAAAENATMVLPARLDLKRVQMRMAEVLYEAG